MFEKYALLLDAEARRHQAMALLAQEPKMKADHEETMLALWAGAEALRREAKQCHKERCRKSATRGRLSLTPLPKVKFRRTSTL